jgi:hypothetical protein
MMWSPSVENLAFERSWLLSTIGTARLFLSSIVPSSTRLVTTQFIGLPRGSTTSLTIWPSLAFLVLSHRMNLVTPFMWRRSSSLIIACSCSTIPLWLGKGSPRIFYLTNTMQTSCLGGPLTQRRVILQPSMSLRSIVWIGLLPVEDPSTSLTTFGMSLEGWWMTQGSTSHMHLTSCIW